MQISIVISFEEYIHENKCSKMHLLTHYFNNHVLHINNTSTRSMKHDILTYVRLKNV